MDLADYLELCLLDCWNYTLETHWLMSNESSCCGQPRRSRCTLGIDRLIQNRTEEDSQNRPVTHLPEWILKISDKDTQTCDAPSHWSAVSECLLA